MKTIGKDILTTRYGGVIPIIKEMMRRGMPELIDSILDEKAPRKHNAKYKFSDMFLSWIAASLCGATRIDNITGLRKDLETIPGLKIPSHDSIGRMMKLLADEIIVKSRNQNHQTRDNYYDDNLTLNKLLIESTVLIGALNKEEEYILDVDCTFISTRCVGAKSAIDKNQPGFYPMVCLIGELPVFVSMRNGNTTADFRVKECIETCLKFLDEAGIKIKKVRTDGAGYRRELLLMLNARNTEFVTASPVNASYKKMFEDFNEARWSDVTIETANSFKECQIAEIKYKMWGEETEFRVIALKAPNESKLISQLTEEEIEHRSSLQKKMKRLEEEDKLKANNKKYSDAKWNEIKDFHYKMITTNDFETPAEELIYFYNQRGESERQFSFMKNDFGWNLPPFQWMNENTVFFILTAMANNVFRGIAQLFNEHIDELELKARVRRFQKAFIDTVAICINGQWSFYNTKIDFGKIV